MVQRPPRLKRTDALCPYTTLVRSATADSTFFTSVRMRDTRFLLTFVRAVLRRMRFFACGVLAINSSSLSNGQQGRSTASTEQPNRARSSESMSRSGRFKNDRTLLEGCAHSQRTGEGQWRLRENPALALAFGAIKSRSPALEEEDARAASSAPPPPSPTNAPPT